MSDKQLNYLIKLGLCMFTCIPIVLGGWAAYIILNQLEIVQYTRYSAICVMFILAIFIYFPLFMPFSAEDRKKGFIFYWFSIAAIFNVSWQIPLIIFRDIITNSEVTHENLVKFIPWWGYGFADSHYGRVSDWMMSEELWWFMAIVISVMGLYFIRSKAETRGYLMLGIAGALQSYNASLYMVYDSITGLKNVPDSSPASLILYWGFNPLWAISALIAALFCFNIVLRKVE